jgi:hypothetical protein
MGLDYERLDSGCCGMADSFGFEREHDDVSMKVGELALLPAVRRAARDVLIIADGFSCRTQFVQATARRALHLADVLDMAATTGPHGPAGDYPERICVPDPAKDALPDRGAGVLTVAFGVAAAGALLFALIRKP